MFQPPEIPEDYLKAIGLVNVNWNHLEAVLDLCLIKLLGKDIMEERSHIVFAHMSFPQRIDIFNALIIQVARQLPPSSYLATHAQSVQSLLKAVAQERNSITHCRWGKDNGTIVKLTLSARGSFKVSSTPTTVGDIEKTAANILRAAGDLYTLLTSDP